MGEIVISFDPDEGMKAIPDGYDNLEILKDLGMQPLQRASHVEQIREGPEAWRWQVDMSPLGPEYQYCLWPSFATREEALDAEHKHIVAVWIEGDHGNRKVSNGGS